MILVKTQTGSFADGWQRPVDWPSIINPAANTIKLLVADTTFATYAFKAIVASGGTYTVNWGDGNTDSGIASDSLATHTYAIGTGTACSRGYTTFVITISATNTITRFYIQAHSLLSNDQQHGYLDAEFGTTGLTTLLNMFYMTTVDCRMLEHCRFNAALASCLSGANAFTYCTALQSVDVSKLTAVTTGSEMFMGCYELRAIDISHMAALTSTASMFYYCYDLTSVNVTGLSSVTTAIDMFHYCTGLSSIDISTMTGITSASSMFEACYSLRTVLMPVCPSCTSSASMFQACYCLQSVDLSGMTGVTTASNMFYQCNNLLTLDLSAMTGMTTCANICMECYSLNSVNVTGLTLVNSATSMFRDCYNLLTFTGLSTLGSAAASVLGTTIAWNVERPTALDFSGCKFTKLGAYGVSGKLIKLTSLLFHASSTFSSTTPQITITYCSFSAAQLDTFFDTLPAMAKTIAITGTTGAATVTRSGGTTSGSTTITMATTTGMTVGMEVVGTGVSTARAVTFTDVGDLVGLASHGIPDGTIVYFQTIVTTTGISVWTPYYVVNAGTNDFQVSDSLGGSPKALTTNGTGTMTYSTKIQTVNPGVSIVVDIPASSTGTNNMTGCSAQLSKAIGRGWTVTN